jgi:hypothetical protein
VDPNVVGWNKEYDVEQEEVGMNVLVALAASHDNTCAK